jgi:NAD(P)-dependent dehydrogenase (short-subunit alcohol dehydrogenase family)
MTARQQIEGRVALVTGANRGIGRAIVGALLGRGARKVYAAARRPETLAELVSQRDERVVAVQLDITNAAEVQRAATQADDIDLLINNAGMVGHAFGGFDDSTWPDAARREFETNVVGTLRVSQAFAPVLARNGGGTIVNMSSVAGLVGMPLVLTYSSSKAALHSLTQSMRQLLRAQGTFVAGVYPGPVDTDMAAEFTVPKVSAASAAEALLDGLERGREDIYPDPFAVEYGDLHAVNPKGLEERIAALIASFD